MVVVISYICTYDIVVILLVFWLINGICSPETPKMTIFSGSTLHDMGQNTTKLQK